jgi:hypothetical protein
VHLVGCKDVMNLVVKRTAPGRAGRPSHILSLPLNGGRVKSLSCPITVREHRIRSSRKSFSQVCDHCTVPSAAWKSRTQVCMPGNCEVRPAVKQQTERWLETVQVSSEAKILTSVTDCCSYTRSRPLETYIII